MVMKIAIVGAGGIGGFFGARLAALKNDVEVSFLVRAQSGNFAAMKTNGLILKSVHGDATVKPCNVSSQPEQIGACDFVLVCVKTFDLQDVAPTLRPLLRCDGQTAIVPLQNGMEAPSVLAAALGK